MGKIDQLFEQNKEWAESVKEENPEFFTQLSKGQEPEILWIGCSDSRVPANQIMDLPPGELFVHRNIANRIIHTDLNSLSVIQYAVEALQVNHIVVCGHYGCGGIKAAIDNQERGLIDNWLRDIKEIYRSNAEKLDNLAEEEKVNQLCELNVQEQVKNISNTTVVQKAWKNDADLTVHGWIYSLKEGLVEDLDISISSPEELED